jgi:hypothetical protein
MTTPHSANDGAIIFFIAAPLILIGSWVLAALISRFTQGRRTDFYDATATAHHYGNRLNQHRDSVLFRARSKSACRRNIRG